MGVTDASRATTAADPTCFCVAARLAPLHVYTSAPEGEVRFQFSSGTAYRRELNRCTGCGHVVSTHRMDTSALYSGAYVDATYGDLAGVRRTFDRINALPPEKSDNVGRVAAILAHARRHFGDDAPRTVLDVGSGLCVFLARMKQAGWQGTALDPDPRAVQHAAQAVGVEGIAGDFMTATPPRRFEVVTFNKVLEHVVDPVAMLARARHWVEPGGLVYVELPDADGAWTVGPGREEFFVEHWHVFSAASLCLLAARAGFIVDALERLQEPSSKFTLRAFLRPGPSGRGPSADGWN